MSYIPFQKTMITPEGGLAVRYTNKTGANSEKGRLVEVNSAQANSVKYTNADSVDPIGAMYEDGVADGSETWIVVSGIADVLLDEDTGASVENWVRSGDDSGYANATAASPPAFPAHQQEIGHALEAATAGGAGTYQLIKINMHFL